MTTSYPTLIQTCDELASGRTTSVALIERSLNRAREESVLNAFTYLAPEAALREAQRSDARRANGATKGPFDGVPLAVKDLEDARGLPTSHGSRMHAGSAPAAGDAPLVSRLREAGAVVIGKTNTPELGWKGETDNPQFGATRNPWDPTRTSGGSSGGSATAISAGIVPLATGSDCGGSIRIPAALCGISGFKPSPGMIAMTSLEPPHFHTAGVAGPMARTIADTIAVWREVLDHPLASALESADGAGAPVRRVRIAWSPDLGYAHVDTEIASVCREAINGLDPQVFDVRATDPLLVKDPIGTWLTIINAYNMRVIRPFVGTPQWNLIDPGLRSMAETALKRSAVDLVDAFDECWRLERRLDEFLGDDDVLVCPTVGGLPPIIGERAQINGVEVDNWVQLPYVFNLTESPVATVPVGLASGGLPVSVQLVGRRGSDADVLYVAALIEGALSHDILGLQV